ncbi:MAG TPA: 3-phosphoserine/phosphohydroxythreonine transaminase [Pyrinomonadaceae bacterium]|nr:3-phosphoserine/phosphohydroxythreonine transaminase [Pyrinomonadaceae bacterium]
MVSGQLTSSIQKHASERKYNFCSGPALLPLAILEQAQVDMLSYKGSGIGIMELSHRSALFTGLIEEARSRILNLLGLDSDFEVIFFQGGATLQFSALPLNFIDDNGFGAYIVNGHWSKKAFQLASQVRSAKIIWEPTTTNSEKVPTETKIALDKGAAFLHYTSNETIDGIEFHQEIVSSDAPVICDASSNILTRPIDPDNFDLIYASAQKNLGPSGLTVSIIRKSFLDKCRGTDIPLLDYRAMAQNHSLLNTPNTWAIYLVNSVCKWIEDQGGVEKMHALARQRSEMIYEVIDNSDGFYQNRIPEESRSRVNVVFHLPTKELEEAFLGEAEKQGFYGLAGHRSVGGIRASMYNPFPPEGAQKLSEFMKDFAAEFADF